MVDERFDAGIRLFNGQEFFDAHEVWEEVWQEYRGEDRTFLQALIQLAAGFYHAQCGNDKGARSQLSKGLSKLRPYAPEHRAVASAVLLVDVERWLTSYTTSGDDGARDGWYPRIHRI